MRILFFLGLVLLSGLATSTRMRAVNIANASNLGIAASNANFGGIAASINKQDAAATNIDQNTLFSAYVTAIPVVIN